MLMGSKRQTTRYTVAYIGGVCLGFLVPLLFGPSRTLGSLRGGTSYRFSRIEVSFVDDGARAVQAPGGGAMQERDVRDSRGSREAGPNDSHVHQDDRSLADKLYEEVRVLCWMMIPSGKLQETFPSVNATWGHKCHTLLVASDTQNDTYRTMNVSIPLVASGDSIGATVAALDYISQNHALEFDWFIRAEDDTYVVLENLRYFLSGQDPGEKIYFGDVMRQSQNDTGDDYVSDGGGYVISRAALKEFGSRGKDVCKGHGRKEGEAVARCMGTLGIKLGDSRDVLGRSRFHSNNAKEFINNHLPEWYIQFSKYNTTQGAQGLSDYPITFHGLKPREMLAMNYYLYHLRPYGIQSLPQELNH